MLIQSSRLRDVALYSMTGIQNQHVTIAFILQLYDYNDNDYVMMCDAYTRKTKL
jgi:hypothetical protein